MSGHETHHQGSFEIEDGTFVVPEAPEPDDRSDLQRAVEEQAERAHQAHEVSRAAREYEVRQSEVYADLGGQVEPLPEPKVTIPKQHGWSAKVGLIDSDSKVRAQIADNQTALRSHAAAVRSQLDEDDKTRNRLGLEQAKAANPPMEREAWDRSHVPNEGDEISPALWQVGDDELRQVPNQE